MKSLALAGLALLVLAPAPVSAAKSLVPLTASTVFKDGPKGEKIHIASGFACPDRIGRYVRDAVGESDLTTGSDFCSYYALDGVYGTVTLTPLRASYDPATSLTSEFVQQEGIGARKIVARRPMELGPKGDRVKVYTRIYETSKLETLHYRIMFTGAAVGKWIVETTIEYAEPRDDAVAKAFLDWAYNSALKEVDAPPGPRNRRGGGRAALAEPARPALSWPPPLSRERHVLSVLRGAAFGPRAGHAQGISGADGCAGQGRDRHEGR